MTTVNMHEAKSQLSKLVDLAHQGEDVIIARNGKPTARVVPIQPEPKRPRPIGLHAGKGWVGDNFNDPMPEEFMKAFE
jgi:prevent-host-death family protein